MKSNKHSFRHDSLHDTQSIGETLEAIMRGIEKGRLVFNDGDDNIIMKPSGLLDFKLVANQKDNCQKVNIKISWKEKYEKEGNRKHLEISS